MVILGSSLLNNSVKLVTKVLANRLQKFIRRVVHQNQYGLIKGRSVFGLVF
jgi:hypothetical protein